MNHMLSHAMGPEARQPEGIQPAREEPGAFVAPEGDGCDTIRSSRNRPEMVCEQPASAPQFEDRLVGQEMDHMTESLGPPN